MANNFTQQQLRNLSQSARSGMSRQQAQQDAYTSSVEQYDREQALSQEQSSDLQNRITTLKAQIKNLEYEESHSGYINPLEAASMKYGKQAELKRITELSGKIAQGGYFENYSELLANTLAEGKVVSSNTMKGFAPALQQQKAQQQYQQTVTYEKVYLDSAGNPISIAPSIAEAQIKKQNLEAEKKMSIAPVIQQYFTPTKITKANIISAVTTNPQPSIQRQPTNVMKVVKDVVKYNPVGFIDSNVKAFQIAGIKNELPAQKKFDIKVQEGRERRAWEGKQKELGKAEYNMNTGEATFSPKPTGKVDAEYNLMDSTATEKKKYYDGRFIKESMTLGVEVETGKKAKKWGLNTQNANLEDNYYVKNRLGFWKNMGVYDESKMGTDSNIKKWYDKSEVKELVTSKGKGEFGPTYKSYEETFEKTKDNPLPYGIQPAQNIATGKIGEEEMKVIRGEKFNLFVPSFYVGEKLGKVVKMGWEEKDKRLNPTFTEAERKAAYGIPSSFNPNSQLPLTLSDANTKPVKIDVPSYVSGGTAQGTTFTDNKIGFGRKLLDRNVSIQGGSIGGMLVGVTAGLQLGTFFGPAFQTGTQGTLEAQQVKKTKTKTKLSDNQFKELGDELGGSVDDTGLFATTKDGKTVIKPLKDLKGGERIDAIRRAFENAKTPGGKESVLRDAAKLYGDDVVKDFLAQDFGIVLNPTVPTSTTGIRDVNLGAVRTTDIGKIGGEMSAKIGSTGNINTNFGIGNEIMLANPQLSLVTMEQAGTITGTINVLGYKINTKTLNPVKKAAKTAPVIGYALKEVSATKTDIIPKQTPRSSSASASALNNAQVPKLTENLKNPQQPKLSSATSSALLSSLLSSTSQVSSSLLKQSESLKQSSRQTTKKITPKSLPLLFGGTKKLVGTKKKKDGYEAFIYKYGKAKSIGKFDLLPSASKKLGTELTETLAASGFVTKKGKKLKATELGLLGNDFRLSKTGNKFLVVERKAKRLRKGSTGKAIQFFR